MDRRPYLSMGAAIYALLGAGPSVIPAPLAMEPETKVAPRDYRGKPSRYMPHQGKRERERRVRQMAAER